MPEKGRNQTLTVRVIAPRLRAPSRISGRGIIQPGTPLDEPLVAWTAGLPMNRSPAAVRASHSKVAPRLSLMATKPTALVRSKVSFWHLADSSGGLGKRLQWGLKQTSKCACWQTPP